MKKIYVLNDNNELQEIDAGISNYSELGDAPIFTTYNGVQLVGSTVKIVDGEIVLTEDAEHRWTEDEVFEFCEHATGGRYDILTEDQGYEILLIDLSKADIPAIGRRYRRIGVAKDDVWNRQAKQWFTITDTKAGELIYQFLNADEMPSSMVVGEKLVLKFFYYSTVGSARVTVVMNDATFTVGTVKSGENIDIDLTTRIVDGNNSISVRFVNDATDAIAPEINITGINISYAPDFNQYKAYTTSVPFNYSCNGSAKKVLHFVVTNAEGIKTEKTVEHDAGYFSGSVTLPEENFSKGENIIETYLVAVDKFDNEITRTSTTSYRIPFLTDNDPLLMVYYDAWDGLKQYGSISIPYYVWNRNAGNLDLIRFRMLSDAISGSSIEYVYDTNEPGALVNYLQYNERHQWLISSLPTSYVGQDDKGVTFTIRGQYGTSLTNMFMKENVTIESSSSAMQTTEGYKFNFAATDLNRSTDEWISTGTDKKTLKLNGFNWNTDGIQIDAEGNQSLHFAPGASAKLEEKTNPLFGGYDTPYTLEISFRVNESAAEQPIITYTNPTALDPTAYGLFIYPNKAIFKYTGGISEINYKSGDRTHLAYTIFNKVVTDTDNQGQVHSGSQLYLLVYLNGILSQMKKINTNDSFPSNCGTIEFNTGKNEFDLYVFRGYSFSLSSAQLVQNYISSFGDATKKEEIYLKNNIYDSVVVSGVPGENEISFNKLKGKIPILVIVSDVQPDTKTYVNGYTIFYEREGEEQLTEWKNGISMATTYYYTRQDTSSPWIRNKKVKYCGQGTSSLAYPRKNFKFKYNDKFYIKGHKDGKEKTFTMKADYMDSSGANNIGNAQVLDDAIVREKWINTPVAENPNLRVNLDGFPIAIFWCKSDKLQKGVVQDENATDVFDNDKKTALLDAVKPNAENPLLGEVTPLNPQYVGTFNFNYDKKAKKLLGWNEDNFQGFEYRGNSSSCDLMRGFENFSAMASTSEGFEWRWTFISDFIDDYHDGNLGLTIDGGYFDEDVQQKYDEAAYLADRKNISYIKPFNRFFIERDGKQLQLVHMLEDGTYEPINYGSFNANNLNWSLTSCEGISKPDKGICLEYGVKFGEKEGQLGLLYQLPYGISESSPLGKAYPDGSHYYKFDWNPQHEHKFEFNEDEDYWINEENWTKFDNIDAIKALKITYTEDINGEYVLDAEDGMYHAIANYPVSAVPEGTHYIKTEELVNVEASDKIITWDFMKDIFKNWCYVNEAVAHADSSNYRAIFDSTSVWGNNGNGLFVWDALTNYFAASLITGLCDNYAKNMFMHSYDGGLTWSPAWYDMD